MRLTIVRRPGPGRSHRTCYFTDRPGLLSKCCCGWGCGGKIGELQGIFSLNCWRFLRKCDRHNSM